LFSYCNEDNNKKNSHKLNITKAFQDTLVAVNKALVESEDDEIDNLIARYQWNMNKTSTGLRYLIYKKKSGNDYPHKGNIVTINYSVKLINGIEVYNSSKDGKKVFEIGKRQVERGLEEGVMLMKLNEKAKLVIPSYLAFGLVGDNNRIPLKATLIYDVEVVNIK
jgi:FKBP-type peptidyl-prolyl cis-trans isomerase